MVTTLSGRKTIVICITEGGLFDTVIYHMGGWGSSRTTTYVPVLMFTVLLMSSIMFPLFLVLILREWNERRKSKDSKISPKFN